MNEGKQYSEIKPHGTSKSPKERNELEITGKSLNERKERIRNLSEKFGNVPDIRLKIKMNG